MPLIFTFFLLVSCTLLNNQKKTNKNLLSTKGYSYKAEYSLSDKSGSYVVKKETGLDQNKKLFVTKEQILPEDNDENKVLEKVISMSKPGKIKDIPLFRPESSQYTVWFDGKKYFSQTKIDEKHKELTVQLISPEKQWMGLKKFSFPVDSLHFCYFLQVIECMNYTGFIQKAIKHQAQEMSFYLVWEGYPYIQEQYLIPDGPFVQAKLTYEEKISDKEHRFSLSFGNQVLFYFVDNIGQTTRKIWISQGLGLLKIK